MKKLLALFIIMLPLIPRDNPHPVKKHVKCNACPGYSGGSCKMVSYYDAHLL